MSIKTGTFNQKTSTGTQSISGLGFTPEIILFFSSGVTSDSTYAAHYNGMFGATVGTGSTDSGSVAASSKDAATTGAHDSTGRAAAKAITFCEFGELTKAEADLDSFDEDGFTLDWTTADAVARKINYIAVSGFDSVKLVEWKMNAGAGNQSITGVGFIADVVINIFETNTGNSASTPYSSASGGIGLGAFDASVEWGFTSWDEEGNDTTTRGAQSNVDFFSGVNVAGNARYASFVSMDADGFTVNQAGTFTPQAMCYSLCLKGGPQVKLLSLSKALNQVGATRESVGFRVGGIIAGTANPTLAKAAIIDIMISVGIADRSNQETMEFHVDQLATSDAEMINIPDRGLAVNQNHDATVESQAHFDHFTDDGFQINWGKSPGSAAIYYGVIVFEETDATITGEALQIFTGVFDKKTSTGEQIITGVGFTPKVLMCWYGGAIADASWADFLRRGFGAATSSSNRYACGDSAEEDLTTSNTAATKSPAHVISIVDPDQALEGEADLTSFDADGFTINWSVANGTAYKIHYLALGGSDEIEDAKIVSFVTSLSTGNQSVTGAGFRPDLVLCFGNTGFDSSEDAQYAKGGMLLATSEGISNVGIGNILDENVSEGHNSTTDIDGFIEGVTRGAAEELHSVFVSFDDDGFTFNQLNAAPSPGYRVFALCIKGVYINVGNFNSLVSTTGDKAYTGIGFQPIGLLHFGCVNASDDGVKQNSILTIGCAAGDNENALFSGAKWFSGDLGCISKVGSVSIQDSGVLSSLNTDEEGTFTTFDTDGFTIDWITSDAQITRNMYLAFSRNWIQLSGPTGEAGATASNTLALTQLSSSATQYARSVASVLALIQAVRPSIIFKSPATALSISQLVQQTISFEDVFTPSVESILSLAQAAVANKGISVSTANILALDHLATNDSILSHSASNVLSLAQVLSHNFVLASPASTLSLVQVGGGSRAISESAANILALIQIAATNFRLSSATNALALTQCASVAVNLNLLVPASNTLVLSQSVSQTIDFNRSLPFDELDDQALITLTQTVSVAHNIHIAAANTLALTTAVRLKEHNESVETFLSFAQIAGKQVPISASNVLFFQQEAARIFKAASQLNLISSTAVSKGRDANNVIPFVQVATILSDYSRALSQDLNLRQSVGLIHDSNANIECIYSPFVGEVTSGITPPPTTAPVLGTATLTLTWPFETPTTTLVLRNPELNNSERFQFARINRATRGGDLKIFSDPTWPKQESLKVQIEALTSAQKDSLQSFFEDNIGLEIGLLDDEDRQWKGIITQPDADFTDVSGDGCTYAVIFEFEGELQ